MKSEKLIKQLFVGKVSEIIGTEKTTELLKEATDAIKVMDEDDTILLEKKLNVTLESYNEDPEVLKEGINEQIKKYNDLGWTFSHHGWERTNIRTIVEIEFEKLK